MIGIAAVGAGQWGRNWVRTLAGMPDADLKYCCDLDEAALADVKHKYPAVQTTNNLEEVLQDDSVEGVVIATSAPTHYKLARRVLEARKHLLVEKPLTLSTADAEDLAQLAQQRGRVLLVGHLLEYHPAVLYIKGLIDSGELGDVYYLYSQRLNLGTIRQDENAWWSLAPHDISVACRLLGEELRSVQCRGQAVVTPEVVDVAFATLEFQTGRLAHIHVSWLDPHKTRNLIVVGSRKMVVFDDSLPAYKVTVYDKGFQAKPNIDSYAEWISLRQGDIIQPRISTAEPLQQEAIHFLDCIRGTAIPRSDGWSGARVVSVLEHGQQSMERGGELVMLEQRKSRALRRAA